MQNTKNMHLKLSSVGQNWPQVAPSWRQVGPKKSTKFDKWPQVGAKLAPNGAKLASKLSQDLQMTPQRAPKEPPKTPLEGPKPRRNTSKRCFRCNKKKLAGIPPCCSQDFAVFLQAVEKTAQFVKKGNTPMETLRKRCFRHAKKNGGHSPLFWPGSCHFSAGSGKKKAPRQRELEFFHSLLASLKLGSAAWGEAA